MAGFPWHALEDNIRGMLPCRSQGHGSRAGTGTAARGQSCSSVVVTRVYTPWKPLRRITYSGQRGSLPPGQHLLGKGGTRHRNRRRVNRAGLGFEPRRARTGSPERSMKCCAGDRPKSSWRPKDAEDATLQGVVHPPGWCDNKPTPSQRMQSEEQRLTKVLNVADLGHLDLDDCPASALAAAGLAADYLASVHLTDEVPLRDLGSDGRDTPTWFWTKQHLRNLELTSTLAGEYEGSLLSTLNACRSAMGRRLLKTWILAPTWQTWRRSQPAMTQSGHCPARRVGLDGLARGAERPPGHGTPGHPIGLQPIERTRPVLAVADALGADASDHQPLRGNQQTRFLLHLVIRPRCSARARPKPSGERLWRSRR